MSRSRCTVVRQQKPPYQDQTTDYHEWSGAWCKHCGRTVAEVLRMPVGPAGELMEVPVFKMHLASLSRKILPCPNH